MSLFRFGFTNKSKSRDNDPSGPSPSTSKAATEDESVASVPSHISGSESDSDIRQPAKRKKTNVVRKYDPTYLSFGFVSVDSGEKPRPLCVVCKELLANSSMLPTKLIRHFTTKHPELKDKPAEYFVQLKTELRYQSKSMDSYTHSELAAIESSFVVSYEIAKAKKPFSVGEQLIQPCLSKVSQIMFGPSGEKKIEMIPLSHQTIGRRFSEMANDVVNQLCARLNKSINFALQFDESTDITNQAILVGFVRYVHDFKIVEDIFCLCSLPDRTTGEKIFEALENKFQEYQLDWKSVVGLCTDGAAAMRGAYKGLTKRISDVANENFVSAHCILHLEALASKKMCPILNETLQMAVKLINNVKASSLNSRIFSLICSEMGSEHETLLLHADVRWLSRGKTLSRLFELRNELIAYFEKYIREHKEKPKKRTAKSDEEEAEPPKPSPEKIFLEKLKDDEWLATLAYLADIFAFLNELCLQTQGKKMNCFHLWNKIEAFQKRLSIWETQVRAMDLTSFALTNGLLTENDILIDYIQPIALNHLQAIISYFDSYFPESIDPRASFLWVVNPFLNANEPNLLTPAEKNELLGNFIH